MFKSYDKIYERLNITHLQINHRKEMTVTEINERSNELKIMHTNNIECTWRILKDNIPGQNRNKKDLPYHLFEHIFRRQNKQRLWDAFIECLRDTNKELIDEIQLTNDTNSNLE